MVPVAILPAAGLLLGIGAGCPEHVHRRSTTGRGKVPQGMFKLITDTMSGAGDIVFANLALLFAIGVAIGLTGDAGVAALAGDRRLPRVQQGDQRVHGDSRPRSDCARSRRDPAGSRTW